MTTTATPTTDVTTDVPDGLWAEPVDRPATGSCGRRWHAVERILPPRAGDTTAVRALAVCRTPVTVAPTYGLFHRGLDPDGTCLECVWTVAVRGGTEGLELAWLRAHNQAGVAALAEAILTAAADDDEATAGERDHPATVQLLTVVDAHAPVELVDQECAEQGCEHPPQPCPVTATACPVCSVRAGGWAGEWEGTYQPECTIYGPCEVLRTIAGHYRVPMPAPAPPPTAAPAVGG